MKKKLLIALGIILTLCAAVIVVVGLKANDLVASFKPQIEDQLSKALGTKVSLNSISVSLLPSPTISVEEVSVLNSTGTKTSLSVGALKAAVSLSALLSKKIVVTELEVVSPTVTLVKDATGVTIPGVSPSSGSAQSTPPTQSSPPASTTSPAPLDLKIDRIIVSDGKLLFDDKVAKRATSVKDINLDAGISLEGQNIKVPSTQLSFSLFDKAPISLTGERFTYDQSNGSLSVGTLKLSTSAGDLIAEGSLGTTSRTGTFTLTALALDLGKLGVLVRDISPTLSQFKTTGRIGTTLALSIAGDAPVGISGPVRFQGVNADLAGTQVRDFTGELRIGGDLQNLTLAATGLALKVNGSPFSLDVNTKVTPTTLSLSTFTARGLGGEIRAPSNLALTTPQTFSTQPVLSGITLTELLKTFQPSIANSATGTIERFEGNFTGALSGDVTNSISGRGSLLLKDGALKNVNLPGLVLSKVSNIPLLEGTLMGHVAPEHRRYFEAKDTPIKELSTQFQLQSGTVSIGSLEAQSDAFTLRSSGSVRIGGALNLSSSIALAPDISASMAKRSKTVASMLSRDGTLIIPFLVQGTPPAVVVLPDVSKLMEGAGRQALEQAAGKALNKVFGGGGDKKNKNQLKGILGF